MKKGVPPSAPRGKGGKKPDKRIIVLKNPALTIHRQRVIEHQESVPQFSTRSI